MSSLPDASNLPFIPVNVPRLAGKEKENLIECIDTAWISAFGPFVKKFEIRISQLI